MFEIFHNKVKNQIPVDIAVERANTDSNQWRRRRGNRDAALLAGQSALPCLARRPLDDLQGERSKPRWPCPVSARMLGQGVS